MGDNVFGYVVMAGLAAVSMALVIIGTVGQPMREHRNGMVLVAQGCEHGDPIQVAYEEDQFDGPCARIDAHRLKEVE